MPDNNFFNTGAMPTVRRDQIISYDLGTHGTMEFTERLSDEALRFLNHANQNLLVRKVKPFDAEFRKHLEEDGFDTDDLTAILNLVDRVKLKGVTFKTKKRLSKEEINQAIRGFDILANLSVFGRGNKVSYAYAQFRVSDNEITKVKLVDGKFRITKGYLAPVWTDESVPV